MTEVAADGIIIDGERRKTWAMKVKAPTNCSHCFESISAYT